MRTPRLVRIYQQKVADHFENTTHMSQADEKKLLSQIVEEDAKTYERKSNYS